MDEDEKEVRSLVGEKKQIEAKLIPAGGNEFHFLLQDCADLIDIIDEIEEVSSQMGEKEHAAFEAKIKFSRKVRRKAKDLKNFEQHLVSEYENKHITLEHGKRMVSIIKLLRSKSVDKAKREATEFYGFLEMGARLEIINDLLLKKKAQNERAIRGVETQLSELEWLEKEMPINDEQARRHAEYVQMREKLSKTWLSHVQVLKSVPLYELLKKMRENGLDDVGFPKITETDADALSAFLQKSKLEAKSAEELHEMAGQREQLLRHLGVDLHLFRQEVAARRDFLFGIMSYSPDSRSLEMGSPARIYLSEHDVEARKLVDMLSELEKTAKQDNEEWERANRINEKRDGLAGANKAALTENLQKLRALGDVLDKKAPHVKTDNNEKENGIVGSILKFLGG